LASSLIRSLRVISRPLYNESMHAGGSSFRIQILSRADSFVFTIIIFPTEGMSWETYVEKRQPQAYDHPGPHDVQRWRHAAGTSGPIRRDVALAGMVTAATLCEQILEHRPTPRTGFRSAAAYLRWRSRYGRYRTSWK